MIDPFPERVFASPGIINYMPHLKRFDDSPHIIFTGRADRLWRKSFRCNRDAIGPFLKQLSQRGVHIFLDPRADTKGLPNLHLQPQIFFDVNVFESGYSQYISQFDAHLVMYNECNKTNRTRVSGSLGTRLAYALTSICPIAVTRTSKFMEELWQDTPFGFTFKDVDDLVESLRNTQLLTLLRHNMKNIHRSYAFESQGKHIDRFFREILAKPEDANN
jgi:hypothetical protein